MSAQCIALSTHHPCCPRCLSSGSDLLKTRRGQMTPRLGRLECPATQIPPPAMSALQQCSVDACLSFPLFTTQQQLETT